MSDNFQLQAGLSQPTIRSTDIGAGQMQHLFVAPARRTPVGPPEKLTIGTGATVGLTPPVGATHALLWVETNDIRYYEDGSTPTTGSNGNGPPVAAGTALELDLASFTSFKMIGKTGTATAQVLYWKYV